MLQFKHNDKLLCYIQDDDIIKSLQGIGVLVTSRDGFIDDRYEGTYYMFNSKGNIKYVGKRAIMPKFVVANIGRSSVFKLTAEILCQTYPEFFV